MKKLVVLILPLALLLVLAGLWLKHSSQTPDSSSEPVATGSQADPQPAEDQAVAVPQKSANPKSAASFDAFLVTYGNATPEERIQLEAQGIALGKERATFMKSLMEDKPHRALKMALRFDEWEMLPESIQQVVERPFSAIKSVDVLPNCNGSNAPRKPFQDRELDLFADDQVTYSFGRRLTSLSKTETPLFGFELENRLVVSDTIVRPVAPEEIETVKRIFPESDRGLNVDPLTGNATSKDLLALVGNHLHAFESKESMDLLEKILQDAEDTIGPKTMAYPINALIQNDIVVEDEVIEAAIGVRSTWTENPKDVLCIRVDFEDRQGAAFTQPDLIARMGQVSDLIEDMSYGETELITAVTSQIFRLPQTAEYYVQLEEESGDGASLIMASAKNLVSAANVDLNDYDIWVVSFPEIDFDFAGLASVGGQNHWLNGNYGNDVIAHEFGHNYGLSHDGRWETEDGTVMGEGTHEEYGNTFSLMGFGEFPQGHFTNFGKHKLEWMEDTEITEVTEFSGTYRLYRHDHPDAESNDTLALKVQRESSEQFWVEYRGAFDAVFVLWDYENQKRTRLIDMVPGGSAGDAALGLNTTFTDSSESVHITPVAFGGTFPNEWVDIEVFYGFVGADFSWEPIQLQDVQNLFSIRCFDGEVIAVGTESVITSNDAGDTWDAVTLNNTYLYDVTKVGNTYYATGDFAAGLNIVSGIFTTTNPIGTWDINVLPSFRSLYGIASTDEIIVAVGDRGTIYTNTGSGFVLQNSGTTTNLNAVAVSSSGLFFATGEDGVSVVSSDGITWTSPENFPAVDSMEDAEFLNGSLVTSGISDGFVKGDSEGTNWENGIVPPLDSYIYGLTYGGGVYLAVGWTKDVKDEDDPEDDVFEDSYWRSTDGVNWSVSIANTGFNQWNDVTYCDGYYFVAGLNGRLFRSQQVIASGFGGWQENFFGDSGDGAPDEDPDGDGVVNLIEYGFGMDPTTSDPMPCVMTIEEDYLTITIDIPAGITDINYAVERSTSLEENSWTENGLDVIENTSTTLKVRGALKTLDEPREFLRIRMTKP